MEKDRENNVVFIDPIYIQYRKMWKEERWKFSGELVRLTIKYNKGELTENEDRRLSTLQRIIDENDGKWTEGYEFDEGLLRKLKNKKK
jgi:hypothetical protein